MGICPPRVSASSCTEPESPYARIYNYDDVDALTREDLLAFQKAFYRPGTLSTLVAWGDFKAEDMKGKIAAAFAAWKGERPRASRWPLPSIPPATRFGELHRKTDQEQTTVLMGEHDSGWTTPTTRP